MALDTARLANLVAELFRITDAMTALADRSFTPDGHLVGTIGEVLAADAYALVLSPPSTKGCDAKKDDKLVEIKATFGTRVAFRRHGEHHIVHHCLVLQLYPSGQFSEVYNGPMDVIAAAIKNKAEASNGQIALSLSQLRRLNDSLHPTAERLPLVRSGMVKPPTDFATTKLS